MLFTTFHACSSGGNRLKSTSFLTNNPELVGDGQHEHLPWGIDMETQQFQQLWRLNIPNCGRRLCHNLLDLVISMLLNDKPIFGLKEQAMYSANSCGLKQKRGERAMKNMSCTCGVFHVLIHLVSITKSLRHPFDELGHLPFYSTRANFNLLNRSKNESCNLMSMEKMDR